MVETNIVLDTINTWFEYMALSQCKLWCIVNNNDSISLYNIPIKSFVPYKSIAYRLNPPNHDWICEIHKFVRIDAHHII